MKNRYWALLLFLLTGFFAFYPVTDTDIWWHLSAAREMLARHSFLSADPLSFTPSVMPWLNLHWLYQLLVYGVYEQTGRYGLILLKGLFFGSAAVLVFISAKGHENRFARLFFSGLIIFLVRYLMPDRPVMVTILCMMAFLYALERFRESGNKRFLLLLVPVQVFWINSQGLSAIGLFIAACFLIEAVIERSDRTRPLAVFLVGLMLCVFANPYGWKGALLPFRLLLRLAPSVRNSYSMNISENVPLRYLPPADAHYAVIVLFLAALVLATAFINRRALRPGHLLLFAGFLGLSLLALRNVVLFTFIGLFIINANLAGISFRLDRTALVKAAGRIFAAALLLALVFAHSAVLLRCRGLDGLSPFRVPSGAVQYLQKHPIPGRCFNADRYGGYLSWSLGPETKTFIDGRFTIKPAEVFTEYFSALDTPDTFLRLESKYGITHVLLTIAVFDRHLRLARALYRSEDWELLFIDGSSVLFAKRGTGRTPAIRLDSEEDMERIKADIRQQWSRNPAVGEEAVGYLERFNSPPLPPSLAVRGGLVPEKKNADYLKELQPAPCRIRPSLSARKGERG